MKISDISNLSKEDILAALGLESKATTTERVLGSIGIFGVGLLVGAGVALLLAPKSGEDLREDLGQRIRNLRQEETGGYPSSSSKSVNDEVRT
jgi:YtxH-like protein